MVGYYWQVLQVDLYNVVTYLLNLGVYCCHFMRTLEIELHSHVFSPINYELFMAGRKQVINTPKFRLKWANGWYFEENENNCISNADLSPSNSTVKEFHCIAINCFKYIIFHPATKIWHFYLFRSSLRMQYTGNVSFISMLVLETAESERKYSWHQKT